MADEKVPAKELEKARSLAKGRFVLHTESPQSLIMFGLRREVLEGKALEPRRILAELDKVTAKDVQRVAQDLIDRKKLHLAVIGPFDDESRFRDLLAGQAPPQARRQRQAGRRKARGEAEGDRRAGEAGGGDGQAPHGRGEAQGSARSAPLGRFGQFQVVRRVPSPARASACARAGCSRRARRS